MDYTAQLSAIIDLGNATLALLLTAATIGLFVLGLRTAEALT